MPGLPTQAEPTTRREIVHLLRTMGPMTVAELGRRLGITHVAVRRHLTALERDGLVDSIQERQPMGRPTRLYSLTDAADDLFPKKYGALSLEIMDFLSNLDPDHELVDQFFAHRKEGLMNRYGADVRSGATMTERLSRLTEIQSANGYLASWEALRAGEFIMKEYNCPVHAVSRKYPHACHHEMEFFKQVLGTSAIVREECIAFGGNCCRYRVQAGNVAENGPVAVGGQS